MKRSHRLHDLESVRPTIGLGSWLKTPETTKKRQSPFLLLVTAFRCLLLANAVVESCQSAVALDVSRTSTGSCFLVLQRLASSRILQEDFCVSHKIYLRMRQVFGSVVLCLGLAEMLEYKQH